ELRMANIQGDRPKKSGSCKVNLKGDHAGDWHDFATDQKGDVLDTLARATGLTGRELLAKAAEIVRASPSSGRPRQPSKVTTPLRSPDGHILPAIHRTYLADDWRAKADMPKPRMLLGPSRGSVMLTCAHSPRGDFGSRRGHRKFSFGDGFIRHPLLVGDFGWR